MSLARRPAFSLLLLLNAGVADGSRRDIVLGPLMNSQALALDSHWFREYQLRHIGRSEKTPGDAPDSATDGNPENSFRRALLETEKDIRDLLGPLFRIVLDTEKIPAAVLDNSEIDSKITENGVIEDRPAATPKAAIGSRFGPGPNALFRSFHNVNQVPPSSVAKRKLPTL